MKKNIATIIFLFSASVFADHPLKIQEFHRKNIGIEGVFNESVQKNIKRYYTDENKRLFLSTVLYNSAPYRPYIIEQLKKKKMPLFYNTCLSLKATINRLLYRQAVLQD